MFGRREGREYLLGRMNPELSREALGVGPAFPGIAPNPLLSPAAVRRTAALAKGELAFGVVVRWHELNNNPRLALVLDVHTASGALFRGIADETITITELTRLQPGQRLAVRYRPDVMDHCVALARNPDPTEVERLAALIDGRSAPS